MIYKFTFTCEEVNNFKRVFQADSEATFLDLHKAILASVGYPDDQMTSFFLCNDEWEKEQEVTLVEMGSSFEFDNMVMETTKLSDLLYESKQRLMYVFDPMFERYFFGSLTSIQPGHCEGVQCTDQKGKAPKQLQEDGGLMDGIDVGGNSKKKADDIWNDDEDLFGSTLDLDDLDAEGFQDLSFEDGTMF